VDDVIEAILLSLVQDGNITEVYNVGSGIGHTTLEIAERIARLTDKHVKPIYAPERDPPCQIVCDITRASAELGYSPQVNLDSGLTDEIRFFSHNPQFWCNE
jgi:nucleoside-diphosphate-sugar epimerase